MSFRDQLARVRGVFYRPTMTRRSATIFLAMSLIFIIALIMRLYPAQYGWFLNEFDPYFDYYASYHVVVLAQQHGLIYALFNNPANCSPNLISGTAAACHTQQGYYFWHDIQTW